MTLVLINKERSWPIEFSIALLLLLPGYWFGHSFFALSVLVLLLLWCDRDSWRRWSQSLSNQNKFDIVRYAWVPALFFLLALVNKFVLGNPMSQLKDCYSSFLLLPILMFVAWRGISARTVLWIVSLVSIEVLIAVWEYAEGVPSFFIELGEGKNYFSRNSLYESRVFGLGGNSPIFAQRCFLALFLVQAIPHSRWFKFSVAVLLGVGIFLSFNRSVIIAVLVYLILLSIELLWKNRLLLLNWKTPWRFEAKGWLLFTGMFLGLFSTNYVQDSFYRTNEVKRSIVTLDCPAQPLLPNAIPLRKLEELNPDGIFLGPMMDRFANLKLSGRELIWMNYLDFLDGHLWRGNRSDKLMLQKVNTRTCEAELVHAHNSMLMVLSMHGMLLGGLFLMMYLLWWKGKNKAFIAAIAIYSITQYGVFWGFSFIDVIFIVALILPINAYEYGSE